MKTMMKVLAFLAIVAIVVNGEGYKFTQPKYPCAYEMKMSMKQDGKAEDYMTLKVNGRYLWMNSKKLDDMTVVYRPDINKKEDGVEMLLGAGIMDGECLVQYVSLKDYLEILSSTLESAFQGLDNYTWAHKEEGEYNGKKCTVYYDTEIDQGAIYVYEGYIYVVHSWSYDLIIENKWEAPMESFVLKECKKENSKLADTPSESYIFCAASNLKVAFITILVALLSALF